MFGFVVARQDALSEEELARYKQVYCGLCRRLGERYGQLSRLSLTYDMTFLTLLLQSLYEPEETGGIRGCAAHPVRRRAWSASEATDYAADMTVALMWHKCRDDWQDDHAPRARVYEALLGGAYHQVRERYPRQCEAIERCMRDTAEAEKQPGSGGAVCQIFGQLMGEVLVWREDVWSGALRQLGLWLGQFICLMDAAVDYDRDVKRGRYNAVQALGQTPESVRETLMVLIGRATEVFERLPLEQDLGLMRNILYAGVWQQYNSRRAGQEEKEQA